MDLQFDRLFDNRARNHHCIGLYELHKTDEQVYNDFNK